jgi:nucleoside 2-deoxyribosyltransferase
MQLTTVRRWLIGAKLGGSTHGTDSLPPATATAPGVDAERSLRARNVVTFVRGLVKPSGENVVTAGGVYGRRVPHRAGNGELLSQGLIGGDPSAPLEPLPRSGPIRVFVAMSFREEEEPALVDYWQAMLRAAEKARREFTLIRLDQVKGDYDIVDRLFSEIAAADLVIADLTLSPSNVYLEIGFARGRRKHVIQTCRSDTRLEFDIRGRRTVIYRNATTLEHQLLQELDALTTFREQW